MPQLYTLLNPMTNVHCQMRNLLCVLLTFATFACAQEHTLEPDTTEAMAVATTVSTAVALPTEASVETDYASDSVSYYEQETATFYVVVADTGNSYDLLREHMLAIHRGSDLKIDTMGRSYDAAKDLIALPEDDEDELYAGDYFPRRFPSKTLSLEYLSLYQRQAGEKTIALVAGIYDRQISADSAAAVIRQLAPKAFAVNTEMFVGCLH
ncbi:hypothetical protein ACSX1A_03165 [Pontibacter sp. MBLB2868]|uniref:hypothetical protein n=1 Tax=Pontibacter sp. MBLB2868 TaxID=3451555 RepID=UPI003F7543DA